MLVEAEWLIALFLLVGMPAGFGASALIRYALARHRRRSTLITEGALACPRSGADVTCVLERDSQTGHWLEVHACSAQGGLPECDQRCVGILNMGIPLRPRAPEGARSVSPENAAPNGD